MENKLCQILKLIIFQRKKARKMSFQYNGTLDIKGLVDCVFRYKCDTICTDNVDCSTRGFLFLFVYFTLMKAIHMSSLASFA